MRFVVMTACFAVMASFQSAPAHAQMQPWGTWETRYGSGSMFTSYGPAYYTGYAPVYYTAAYGPSYYNGGCCGIASPCSGGACGSGACGSGACGGCSPCGSGGCGTYSAGYGYDCGCGTGCCDSCAGGCNGCSSCGGAGCSGGNCANCVGTPSGSNMTPAPDNNRPAGPQPTPANPPRNPETDNFNRAVSPPAGTGTFDNRSSVPNSGSIPNNTNNANPSNNTNPATDWRSPAPSNNIDLGPSGSTPRIPAAGEPGGGSAPAYTPPASSIPSGSGERFNPAPGSNAPAGSDFNPGSNAPRSNDFNPGNSGSGNEEGIRSFKPDTSSVHYIDGPIAHRYEARRLRSQLATASKPIKVSRVAVQDVTAPSEQIASNR